MFNTKTLRPTALAVAVAVGVSGCATVDGYVGDNSAGTNCAVGAALGAVLVGGIVAASGGDAKQIAGGSAAGAALGCGVAYLYKQRVDRLNAVAKQNGLQAEVKEIVAVNEAGKKETVGVEAQVQVQEMFPTGESTPTAEGVTKLRAMADEFARSRNEAAQTNAKAPNQKVLVVGHSDSTGPAELNQRLSEQRARAVGQILADAGIPKSDIYFQGAGSSRPIADNTTETGRAKNRRVEFVEVSSEAMLAKRVESERGNTKYLAHTTATEAVKTAPAPKAKPTAAVVTSTSTSSTKSPTFSVEAPASIPTHAPAPVIVKLDGKGGIDFGGTPVTDTYSKLSSSIMPKSSGFSLISTAYADAPVVSCLADKPRVDGEVKNLETGATLKDYSTTDFLPGLNGRVWAQQLNGHVATVGPVGILRDNAKVAVDPKFQFITNAKAANQKQTPSYKAAANTYEGEHQVLYRVFAQDQKNSPVSCMDIVYDKRSGSATAGEIYYAKNGDAYVAEFTPIRR